MSERGRPRKASARRNMTLRLPTGLFERIEAHQAKLEALAGGVSIARQDVLLMLLTKGFVRDTCNGVSQRESSRKERLLGQCIGTVLGL